MEYEAGMKGAGEFVYEQVVIEILLAAVAGRIHGEWGAASAGRTDYSVAAPGTSSAARAVRRGKPVLGFAGCPVSAYLACSVRWAC